MLLEGKRLLITGVLTDDSIAWHVARVAQEEGAEVVLTGFGRSLRLTQRSGRRLPVEPEIVELDINDKDQLDAMVARLDEKWGGIDGALHAIAFAPGNALGGSFLDTDSQDAAATFVTSAFSYKTLASVLRPLMVKAGGGAVVALDFDNSQAWPMYDWMGVAKMALQSVNRYLAFYLGEDNIRANLVAAGPLGTIAAKSIPHFDLFEMAWLERAPLGWDVFDPDPVARMACVLLSDWAKFTSGEIVHVDGGFHAVSIGTGQKYIDEQQRQLEADAAEESS